MLDLSGPPRPRRREIMLQVMVLLACLVAVGVVQVAMDWSVMPDGEYYSDSEHDFDHAADHTHAKGESKGEHQGEHTGESQGESKETSHGDDSGDSGESSEESSDDSGGSDDSGDSGDSGESSADTSGDSGESSADSGESGESADSGDSGESSAASGDTSGDSSGATRDDAPQSTGKNGVVYSLHRYGRLNNWRITLSELMALAAISNRKAQYVPAMHCNGDPLLDIGELNKAVPIVRASETLSYLDNKSRITYYTMRPAVIHSGTEFLGDMHFRGQANMALLKSLPSTPVPPPAQAASAVDALARILPSPLLHKIKAPVMREHEWVPGRVVAYGKRALGIDYSLFFFPFHQYLALFERIQKHMVPCRAVLDQADAFVAKHFGTRPFLGIHYRLFEDNHTHQHLSPEKAVDLVHRLLIKYFLSEIFIAVEPAQYNSPVIHHIMEEWPDALHYSPGELPTRLPGCYLPILDQEIASRGAAFLGTDYSTFSLSIHYRRTYGHGADRATSHWFDDGGSL